MGDMKEIFQSMKEHNKKRKKVNYDKNMDILFDSGFAFVDNGFSILFRNEGFPVCDFYPTTNKWKYGDNKIKRGDAKRFLEWYKNNKELF